jgi:hypothetical protein
MTKTILPITKPLARVCVLLDDLVTKFIAACRETLTPLGKYEAEDEAQNLFKLAIRNLEGVVALARNDLILLPPALAAARACFEAAVKGAWLIDADNPFDREARWLVHLASEERYLARVANELGKLKRDVTTFRQQERTIRDFRLVVEERLPRHIARLKGSPSFKEMVTSLGGESLYSLYILLSQSSHAEHQATWLYRSGGLGTAARIGEFVKPADWWLPLRISFLSISHPGQVLLARLGGNPDHFLRSEMRRQIEESIRDIGNDVSDPH